VLKLKVTIATPPRNVINIISYYYLFMCEQYISQRPGIKVHELFVVHYAVPGITLDLIANTTRLPNVAPYNTFSLTCTGTSSVNGRNVALPKRFQWLRWYGFSEFSLDLLSSNATIQIQNGDDLNQPTSSSVLTVTEVISQNYHIPLPG